CKGETRKLQMMNLTKPQKLIYDMERFIGGSIAVICGSMIISGKKDLSELKDYMSEKFIQVVRSAHALARLLQVGFFCLSLAFFCE
ncbi:MAG: hypothetical protein NC324_08715, partial [Bacteroides sp.]|nr:hypothetical protein [Bacteroides sp.]